MAKKAVEKRKKPYGPDDIAAIEDRLAALQGKFRDIRQSMKDGPLAAAEFKLGTFLLYLSFQEELMPRYLGEFAAQKAKESARVTREKIKASK